MTRGASLWRLGRSSILGITLVASGALADYRHRVLVLEDNASDDASHEVTTRVRAELSAAGFDVSVLAVQDTDPKTAVESAGRELHPAAVILVQPQASGTELWLDDRMLRKTVVLRLSADSAADPARVAVQALELVNARLAELAVTRERQVPRPTPPPAPAPPPAPPESRGLRPNLTVSVGLLDGFREGLRALTPVLRLGVALPEDWMPEVIALDLRGSFVGLGQAAHVERGPASASLRHTAVALDAVVRFLPKRRVQPFVALGGGLLALDVAGNAPEPYRNYSRRTLSGLVNASGGLWLQPFSGIGLAFEAQLLEAWSKTVVRIAEQDVAEVAAPLLLLSGGFMAEF